MAESSFDEASARLSQVAARLLEWIQARGAPPCEVMVICFGRLPGRGSDEELPMGIGTTVSPELAQRVIAKLASMTPILEIKDRLGEPVAIRPDGTLVPMDLAWTLPGELEPERAKQRTVMGLAPTGESEYRKDFQAFGNALARTQAEWGPPPRVPTDPQAYQDWLKAPLRPGDRIRVIKDELLNRVGALGIMIAIDAEDPGCAKVLLDDGYEGTTALSNLERVVEPSLEELKAHWEGCAGAEATINDHRAQIEELRHQATPEIVICAALRLPDGRVLRCHRHHHGIPIALEMVPDDEKRERVQQGFVTSRNRYVPREEALRLQLAAGIPSAAEGGYRPPRLYSEDLY